LVKDSLTDPSQVDILYLPVAFTQFSGHPSERGCLRLMLPDLLRSAGFPKSALYRFGAGLATPKPERGGRIAHVLNQLRELPTSPLWNSSRTQPLKVLLFCGRIARQVFLQSHFQDVMSPANEILQRSVLFSLEGYTNNDNHISFAGMPYPGHVQFSSTKSLRLWTESMLKRNRPIKMALSAGNHSDKFTPHLKHEVYDRSHWLDQCIADDSCIHLPIEKNGSLKKAGLAALGLYSKAEFCLQPPGDSPSRQGIFDSMMVGCIPVLYFPSVETYTPTFIPNPHEVMVILDEPISDRPFGPILSAISKERKDQLRENIMKLLPRLVVSSKPPTDFEDAFDIALKEVVKSPGFTVADLTDDLESWPWRPAPPPPPPPPPLDERNYHVSPNGRLGHSLTHYSRPNRKIRHSRGENEIYEILSKHDEALSARKKMYNK